MERFEEIIAAHAAARPEAPVLKAPGRAPLSYRRLTDEIARIREALNANGFGRGHRIAVIVNSRPETFIALQTLSASATPALMDPKLTVVEYAAALRHIEAHAVVTTAGHEGARAAAREAGLPVITLTPAMDGPAGTFDLSFPSGQGAAPHPGPAEPDDLAYLLMSSGTTSRPKAVCVPHRIAVRRARTASESIGLTHEDVSLNFRPAHVGGAINTGFQSTLYSGGCIVVPPDFDADLFFELADAHGATWYSGGAAYHEAILARAGAYPEVIGRWRMKIARSASYRLPEATRARLETELGLRVVVKYGSTDAGMIATAASGVAHRPDTVGKPLGCEVRILDEDGQPLGPGEEGQIAVRGPELAPGYYNDPEADKAFQDGWFMTGDLGFFDADGYLTVAGRKTLVINRGGQKISPTEVERALLSLDGVADCGCFALPHPTLGQIPAAVVAPEPGTTLDEAGLMEALAARLARYKVPDRIILSDRVPRSPDGKFQPSRALEALGLVEAGDGGGTWTDLKLGLAEIWKRVLGLSSVGLGESFVVRGGDSLQALRLVLEIEEAYGVTLSTETIYGSGATISGMAAAIEAVLAAGDAVPANRNRKVEIAARPPGETVPLTFAQERLWFVIEADPSGASYRNGHGIRFRNSVDLPRMKAALQTLVDRHEILRARFPSVAGRPIQCFDAIDRVELPEIDLRERTEGDPEAILNDTAQALIADPYDIEAGPLFRAHFLRLSDESGVLLFCLSHLITDGISNPLMDREFLHVYSGEDPGALPEPLPYGDYAAWLRERLSGPHLDQLSRYWRESLEGVPTVLALPSDRPRPAKAAYDGGRVRLNFPKALHDQLRRAAAEHGTTVFATALAAFQVLLCRSCGQNEMIIGTGVDGRPPGTEGRTLGLYVNVLPIAARLSAGMTFADLLRQTRASLSEGLRHAEMPFERIVQMINPPRTQSYHPLVQAFFGLMPRRGTGIGSGSDFEPMDMGRSQSRFDFTLMLVDDVDEDGLGGFVEYRKDMFDHASVERLVSVYEHLIDEMTRDPGRKIVSYPLMEPSAEAVLVDRTRGAQVPFPQDSTIAAEFRAQVKAGPELPAVTGPDGTTITYRMLDAWSDAVAAHLVERGVAAGDLVAVSAERSPAFVAGILGCLKAGAGYVPLDPAQPAPRLAAVLDDAATRHALVQAGSALPELSECIERVHLPLSPDDLPVPAEPVAERGAPETPAYVLFTSGSTGRPKGVVIPNRGILRLVKGTDIADLGPDHAFLQVAPTTFDVSSFDIWGCLLNGGHVIQAPWPLPGLGELADLIARPEVTSLEITTPLFEKLVDLRCDCFAHLHQVLVGGDALSPDHARRFLRDAPGARLVNAYGPTENSVWSTAHVVTEESARGVSIPIGRAIANTFIYILDSEGRLLPSGIEGELAVGGPGVGLGYLNAPELTAEKFRDDPFSDAPGARMYLTGDRARLNRAGEVEFRGRIDHQVKIRGFLVEPAEIVAQLIAHPGVEHAHVLAEEGADGQRRLLGFYAPIDKASHGPAPDEVRRHLSGRLPPYLVPARLIRVPALPVTRNGKIDRAALRQIAGETRDRASEANMPRTLTEATLAILWSELLETSVSDCEQSFFEAGGDSLLLMQIAFSISEEFGVEVPLAVLFQDPTIRSIATHIDRRDAAGDTADALASPILCPLSHRRGEGAERPRFFIVSGAGGHVLPFAGVARRLAETWEGIGLVDPLLVGEAPAASVEDLAGCYIDAIGTLDANGPCFIAGYSYGGLVAHEIARQLLADGRRAGVVLIDTHSAALSSTLWRARSRLAAGKRRIEKLAEGLRAPAVSAAGAGTGANGFDHVAERERRLAIQLAQRDLGRRYRPAPHDAPTVLLRSKARSGIGNLPDHGWSQVVSGLEVLPVPGTHLDMFKGPNEAPFSEVLAEALARLRDRV
ncbi:non-ribosomal peptide synthetase [Ovoidimarina sediminis]|uniref:non-ribosomal peptide synthetase n=1 Tax=Ovoidimarina sediminis TaxID=3079856 RepID=UPI002910E6C4|nr:non-ribosomal peptide synthetase [Rhodophyticola sp. MJ-SS7]MDU8944915.1 amino acid adenylation domain-containing protein [Rhodophyticola sp. MJ-SS7]